MYAQSAVSCRRRTSRLMKDKSDVRVGADAEVVVHDVEWQTTGSDATQVVDRRQVAAVRRAAVARWQAARRQVPPTQNSHRNYGFRSLIDSDTCSAKASIRFKYPFSSLEIPTSTTFTSMSGSYGIWRARSPGTEPLPTQTQYRNNIWNNKIQ